MALQYYNHKEHTSTGHAPVEIHLGIDPRHPGLLAPPGQEAAPVDYSKLDDYNKEMAEIARWVRGKVVLRQAEQAREVARYYQNKNLTRHTFFSCQRDTYKGQNQNKENLNYLALIFRG